jgi:hypothetical protein
MFPKGGSLYIPEKYSLHPGWGEGSSVHVVSDGWRPLPDRMYISFYSFLEDKFYGGELALPHARISALFAEGYPSHQEESGRQTFHELVAGLAPGGVVAVWATGIDHVVEVFFGRVEELHVDWHTAMGLDKSVDRQTFIAESLADDAVRDPRVKTMLERIPFGIWSTFRDRYVWQPVFELGGTPERIDSVSYYNGEREIMALPLSDADRQVPRPIPSFITFVVESLGRMYEQTFDEEEMLATFQRLGAGGEPLELVYTRVMEEGESKFAVLVRSRNETVRLRKLSCDFYSTD